MGLERRRGDPEGHRLKLLDSDDGFARSLTSPVLARNVRFKGRHAGESCYIVGNGASLKNMELAAFSDRLSIGVNLLCLHNEFAALNAAYYVVAEPFFFYRYFRNPYIGRFQLNVLGNVFRKEIARHPRVALFTGLSNMLFSGVRRAFFLHHFGHREPDRRFCDIAGTFSFVAGALYMALGLAINLGFSRATLVGCDYLFSPASDGHFYGVGPPRRSDRYDNVYAKLLEESAGLIDLDLISDVGGSRWLPCRDYETATGRALRFRENTEIVSADHLQQLQRAVELKQLTTPIYSAMPAV